MEVGHHSSNQRRIMGRQQKVVLLNSQPNLYSNYHFCWTKGKDAAHNCLGESFGETRNLLAPWY